RIASPSPLFWARLRFAESGVPSPSSRPPTLPRFLGSRRLMGKANSFFAGLRCPQAGVQGIANYRKRRFVMNTVSEPKGVVGGDVVYRRLGQEVEVLPRLIRGGWLAWKKTSSTDELVLTWFPTRGTAAASVEDLGARA